VNPVSLLVEALFALLRRAFAGESEEEIAKGLVDAAFESGVPAAILLKHLTEKGRERAELAADIAQHLKTGRRP
jgi:hypothetical protein